MVLFMGNQKCGKHSFVLEKPPVITAWTSVAGKKESEGPLANTFDITKRDSYFGEKTWEQGEKKMQQIAASFVFQALLTSHLSPDFVNVTSLYQPSNVCHSSYVGVGISPISLPKEI